MYERDRDFAAYSLAARMYPDAFPDEQSDEGSTDSNETTDAIATTESTATPAKHHGYLRRIEHQRQPRRNRSPIESPRSCGWRQRYRIYGGRQ